MSNDNTATEEYPDDGHIFVCVRVRDIPQNAACLTNSSSAAANVNNNLNAGTNTRGSTMTRKSMLREAHKICVSVVENVVVMHDPKALDDAATVAKDGNNVVQMLTDRANMASSHGGTRASRKASNSAGAGATAAATAMTRTNSRRTSTLGGGRATGGTGNYLVPTGTANYYECDHCIASMEQAQMLQMPLVRTSDFLQPPPYGTQEDVYRRTAMHAVKAAVDGINSCVFAYGQTGSGKTYTLFGDTTNIRRDPGVVPRTLDDLFSRLESVKQSYRSDEVTDYSYNVQLSFFEIYQNEVYCLFSRQGPLHVQFVRDASGKKETMVINDLQQQTVASADKAYPLIEMGLRRRQTAETGMNARSSRSHAILQVRVAQYRTNRDTRETVEHLATINLVDLAGSERQKTANTNGKSREEGIQINQSLATLARVINDIASGAKFVNYRDSLLTMVLKDNLGGNSKTFMIANISPIAFSFSESCATLTYAKDVRKIRNRPIVNKTFQTRANLLEQNVRLKQENEKLKEQMEAWARSLQNGAADGGPDDGSLLYRSPHQSAAAATMETLLLSPMNVGIVSPMLPQALSSAAAYSSDQLRAVNRPLAAAGCHEAFLSATSAGLTAPLLISSHRRYTSVAGIGGACVEGGVVRVSALVKETLQFPLRRVLQPVPVAGASVTKDQTKRPLSASPDTEPLAAGSTLLEDSSQVDLGVLQLDRVAQRSCEQRYYVHFLPPTSPEGMARLIDVQVNGKSLGAKGRRELHHGDVVCAYLEDNHRDNATGPQAQSLISFHYVDLNALSRNTTAPSGSSATLGQLAISVDIPEDMEDLTLEGIKQLQRDNAKLLDMVRQQAETIDYQCARASVSQLSHHGNLMEGISPIGSPDAISPDPRSLEASPAAVMPLEPRTAVAVVEAFRRLSEPHGLRGGSVMPADIEADELLRRAAAQSESQQRFDSAVKENEKLHRTVVSRNATLDALAKRLAELEAGDDVAPATRSSSSSSSEESDASSAAESSSVSLSPSANRDDKGATVAGPGEDGISMTRVSSPSATRGASAQNTTVAEAEDEEEEEMEPIGDGKKRVVYENTEGARERYQAVVREREQFDKILELEAIIRDLRERLAELESRLRFSKDETLEQQMLREQAEAERDALLEELADVRRENTQLQSENATLEAFLAKDEEALANAARLAEEEVDRQTSILADRVKALKALARMWKQRTMKYIAMGYGAGSADGAGQQQHLDAIPWDDLRAAETVAIAKRRLGGTASTGCSPTEDGHANGGPAGGFCTAEMAQTIEDFEKDTAVENTRALEYALLDFEQENQRLLEEIRRIQAELQRYKDLIDRLRAEKADMERQLADATGATDEERRRLQQLLNNTNAQLNEAENSLKITQDRLDEAMAQCDNNKRKAVKSNELLLAQQKRTIDDLGAELDRMRNEYAAKDEELRNLTRYMEDHDAMGGEGAAKGLELRSRIEELVTDSIDECEAPAGYSVFPTGFEFSDEMTALIRICLRILLDRLKMELYVLNAQSVHKFGLLIQAVKARTEAHFHTFMHQLRDAVSQMTGRTVRPGGKWGLSEADVLSNLVDHRRRQVGDALNGLLIWYDHWDSAPKTEHVAYMELIRNADRIMQMARLVRRESLLNTNATSTSLMPIPGKNGSSEKSLVAEGSRKKDKTVKDSCKILSRLNSSTRQSNLARAVNQFSTTPSRATIAGRDDGGANGAVESTPFSRNATVTALALSQSMIPFSRTATGTRTSVHHHHAPNNNAAVAPASQIEGCPPFQRCTSGLPRPSATVTPASFVQPLLPTSAVTPMRPSKCNEAGSSAEAAAATSSEVVVSMSPATVAASAAATPAPAGQATTAQARANYSRMATAGVLPVSDADVAYVVNTDVAEAVSINSYNFSRRMSSTPAMDATEKGEGLSSTMRKPNHLFSRCHTSVPRQRESRQLHRQASAGLLKPRMSGGGAAGHPHGSKATETFARSKTTQCAGGTSSSLSHAAAPSALPRRDSLGLPPRGSTGSHPSTGRSSRGAGSPHPQQQPNLSAFYSTSTAARQQPKQSSDPRNSQQLRRSSSTLAGTTAKPQPTAAAAPFYNPSVIKSLRERSTSDVNRSGPSASGKMSTAMKKKPHTSATLSRMSSSTANAHPTTTVKKTKTSSASSSAASGAAFHKTHAEARFSAGGVDAENAMSRASGAPVVPKLNLVGMSGSS